MICEIKKCTGCGLCIAVCPKSCITLEKNEYGTLKYRVDEEKCIHCGKCHKMCPQNSQNSGHEPIRCYAGWATEPSERVTSSSGGIAAAMYRRILNNGGAVVGACFVNGEFRLKLTENEEDIDRFKGSKYVNCTSKNIFKSVKEKIESGKTVLFIGTPCQVASIKSYIGESKLLYAVDLICHGAPPQTYFVEHFGTNKSNIVNVNFRLNGLYRLSIIDKYGHQKIFDGGTDEYYLSFISGITFSDCCYECRYAKSQRISDITIGDFWGIDEAIKSKEKVDRVSLVLCNTLHGKQLLDGIPDIQLIERDMSEALPNNEQLTRPFRRSKDRIKFEKLYPKYGFDKTIHRLEIEKSRKRNILLTRLSNIKKKVKNI